MGSQGVGSAEALSVRVGQVRLPRWPRGEPGAEPGVGARVLGGQVSIVCRRTLEHECGDCGDKRVPPAPLKFVQQSNFLRDFDVVAGAAVSLAFVGGLDHVSTGYVHRN